MLRCMSRSTTAITLGSACVMEGKSQDNIVADVLKCSWQKDVALPCWVLWTNLVLTVKKRFEYMLMYD